MALQIRVTSNGGRSMQLLVGVVCLLLLLQDHTAAATIPTIDNIVKILQSPVVQQLILPRPLVAYDPSVGDVAADAPVPAKPEMRQSPKKPTLADEGGRGTMPPKGMANDPIGPFLIPRTRALPGCPLCDASVYGYCDEKVYHDACCCGSINGAAPFGGGGGGFGGGGFGGGGFGVGGFGDGGFGDGGGGFGGFGGHGGGGGGCGYKGCSYLYANSCYEHQLIVNCCCNSPY